MKRGFTLIELLVVISIISLFSSVALAVTKDAREKARDARVLVINDQLHKLLGINCVSGWNFDNGTANDSCIDSINGTISGATVVNSPKGNALQFDSNGEYVNLGIVNLDQNSCPSGKGITIAAMFKATQWTNGQIINKSNNTGGGVRFSLGTTNVGGANRLQFRLRTDVGNLETLDATSGDLALDRWYLAVAKYDCQTMKLYLDGEEVGSTNKTGVIDNNNQTALIGADTTSGGSQWMGFIDEVRIYEDSFE